MLRARDPEPHHQGQAGVSSHGFDQRQKSRVQLGAGARDAGDGDAIDEPGGGLAGLVDASLGAGRRHEEDEVDLTRIGGAAQVRRLARRKVRHDQSVNARVRCRSAKPFETEGEDWIQISHEKQWHVRPGPRRRRRLQRPRDRHARLQRNLGRRLDGAAVRERIGKRNPELDRIGARPGGRLDQRRRDVETWIAGGEIGDDSQLPLGPQPGEHRGDPAHPPLAWRTMSRSLSPRPDRLTSTISSAASAPASGIA